MVESRSFRAEFPVFFGIRFAVSGSLCLKGHLVGDREIDPSVELNGKPHSAVNFRISFAGIQRPQMPFIEKIKNSVDLAAFLKIDICIKPLGEPIIPENADPDWSCSRTPLTHSNGIHIAPVGKV